MEMSEFRRLVWAALEELPAEFRERMENVAVLVVDWPDRQTLREAGKRYPEELLGFYRGVPLNRRTQAYQMVMPDTIYIYRLPILCLCRSDEEVRQLVRRVVRHEVAHYFGIDDERLRVLGAY